jgi:hypothetical protein
MGWTDDSINYEDDDLIAQIPEAILEHSNGNVEKAYKSWQARITPDDKDDTVGITILHNKELPSDQNLKFALFGNSDNITDEMFEKVKAFAKFVQQEEAKKDDNN